MLSDDEVEKLSDIFYREAPYDYVIVFEAKRSKHYHGVCDYETKVALIYGTDDYYAALHTVLHEIAHARVQHKTHSAVWENEFVNLLSKYNFPRHLVGKDTISGPKMKEYANEV